MIKGYKFGENKFGIKVSNNRGKTHWHECWRVHHECALAKILELYELLHEAEQILPEDSLQKKPVKPTRFSSGI